jgi:hypothetical protein
LSWSAKSLGAARVTLEEHGDRVNAAHARHLEIRRLLLIGRLDEAEGSLGKLDADALPPPLRAAHELVIAGIAVRRVLASSARVALVRAARAARQAGIPALVAEVEAASLVLTSPAARLIANGSERELRLEEVEALLASGKLVVDACRFSIREANATIELARRPVLFTLARHLAEAWPAEVPRQTLIARAFRARRADETYRARLRVEVGRLRRLLRTMADIVATKQGFAIRPRRARDIVVIARPFEDEHAPVLALLADGESWSSSALALALAASTRTVQRALESLAGTGKVQALGHGRARRWMTPPLSGFTTTLLLPAPVSSE